MKSIFFGIKNNIRKYFVLLFTNRRNFIPILGLYYLTFPWSTVEEVAILTSAGFFTGFLLETPSGYVGDTLGHKKTLIISKILFLLSTLCFVLGYSFIWFIVGSMLLNAAFAFSSGSNTALLHETLTELGKDNLFTKYQWRIGGTVSLLSAVFIIALPFFTEISFKLPFLIRLGADIIGLFITMSLVQPKIAYHKEQIKQSVRSSLKSISNKSFRAIMIFIIILKGIIRTETPFKSLYIEDLWLPVALIGLIMWTSRLIWFITSRFVDKIEKKYSLRHICLFLLIFASSALTCMVRSDNPYLAGLCGASVNGVFRGLNPVITHYIIKILPNKKYKATVLSLQRQAENIITVIGMFVLGFVMEYSFKIGYAIIAGSIMVAGGLAYIFVWKYTKKNVGT